MTSQPKFIRAAIAISPLMVSIPTTNAVDAEMTACAPRSMPESTAMKIDAARLAGTLSRKLIDKARSCSTRRESSMDTVRPDRLRPGMTDKPCATPTSTPSINVSSHRPRSPGVRRASWTYPVTSMNAPITPAAAVPATVEMLLRVSINGRPTTPLTIVATKRNRSDDDGPRRQAAASRTRVRISRRKTTRTEGMVPM